MAKKKDSKVSIASVDRLLKVIDTDVVPVHVEIGDEAIDFEVKRLLDIGTFNNMVHEVVDTSFVIDEVTGDERYDAVRQDYATQVAMLTYIANFKPEMTSDKFYHLMHCQAVMHKIHEIWSDEQYKSFVNSIYKQIGYRQDELLSSERRKLQEAIDQINKANDIFAKFVAMFEGVDPAQLMTEMQKICNMDEEQIGRSVVNARDKDFVEQRRAELQVLK